MYFQLTSALKRRFIEELRRYFQYHPTYRDTLKIQGKYAFSERPQHGIVVKASGGNRVDLSADNYVGVVESYCLVTKVRNKPGISVEWVREDSIAIQNNGGTFPSAPGFYYLDLVNEQNPTTGQESLVFYVDPLLEVGNEQVNLVDQNTAQLQQVPVEGSVRLYEMPSGFRLVEGVNYTLDRSAGNLTGGITLLTPVEGGRWLVADYFHPEPSRGPFPVTPMYANNTAIPGVVLAFGRRCEAGDQLAVMVHDIRRPAYLEYAGKWEVSLECDVFSRDVESQEEIVDQTVVYLWGVLRSHLSHQGIEITDVSLGGESEEIYDDNGDDYFYNATFSVTCMTDWSIHVPLTGWLRSGAPLTRAQAEEIAAMSDDELKGQNGNIKLLEDLGLQTFRDPFWSGRQGTFEMVK